MSDNIKYRQLALFSTIVAEVVVTPCALGGLAYWLLKTSRFQIPVAVVGFVTGLIVAFYRISLMRKEMDRNDPGTK